MDLHTALSLYSLTDSDLVWELQRDTRCLLGWNNSTIVVAFRGTASMTNALSDIQVRQCCCSFTFCVLSPPPSAPHPRPPPLLLVLLLLLNA